MKTKTKENEDSMDEDCMYTYKAEFKFKSPCDIGDWSIIEAVELMMEELFSNGIIEAEREDPCEGPTITLVKG